MLRRIDGTVAWRDMLGLARVPGPLTVRQEWTPSESRIAVVTASASRAASIAVNAATTTTVAATTTTKVPTATTTTVAPTTTTTAATSIYSTASPLGAARI